MSEDQHESSKTHASVHKVPVFHLGGTPTTSLLRVPEFHIGLTPKVSTKNQASMVIKQDKQEQMSLPATDLDLTPESPSPSDPPPPSAWWHPYSLCPSLKSTQRRQLSSRPARGRSRVEAVEPRESASWRPPKCSPRTTSCQTTRRMILSYDDSPKQGNGFEVSSDLEEDYFEEYHLSNSHENVFVRHKSFRRKVHLMRRRLNAWFT